MRVVSLSALLCLAGALGQLHAASMRSGGCSDLDGGNDFPSTSLADEAQIPVGRPVGFGHLRGGGCSHASYGFGYGAAPAPNCYQGPAVYRAAVDYQSDAIAPIQIHGPAGYSNGNLIQSEAPGGQGAVVVQTQQRSIVDCGPINSFKIVLEPKYFTETRAVCTTEYQNEVRYRTKIIARTVPIETQDYRTITVMVPRSETKSVEYSVLVPQTNEKTVQVVETVPVWNEITEQYTVKVPQVVDVPEEYIVKVAQLVDQEFTYTVNVPQTQTEMRTQAVTNANPVTKTRTVQFCQPVTRLQTVTKDYGHWEVRVEEVAPETVAYSTPTVEYSAPVDSYPAATCNVGQVGVGRHGCRLFHRVGCGVSASSSCPSVGCGCGGGSACGSVQVIYAQPCAPVSSVYGSPVYSAPAAACSIPETQTVSRRVWVPNVVTEEVAVVENVQQSQEVTYTVFEQQTQQVPYECTYVVYLPETRSGTRKIVNYVDETRTRNRKVVQYNDETRTRTRKQLSYKQETRTEKIPYVSYTTEKRTKEVNFTFNVPETKVEPFTSTRYETVNEEVTEEYTISVPVAVTKPVEVQVCRMVPKLVPVTIYPCASHAPIGQSNCGNCGATGHEGVGNMSGEVLGQPSLAPSLTSGCVDCR